MLEFLLIKTSKALCLCRYYGRMKRLSYSVCNTNLKTTSFNQRHLIIKVQRLKSWDELGKPYHIPNNIGEAQFELLPADVSIILSKFYYISLKQKQTYTLSAKFNN